MKKILFSLFLSGLVPACMFAEYSDGGGVNLQFNYASQVVFSVISPAGVTNSTTNAVSNSSVTLVDDDSDLVSKASITATITSNTNTMPSNFAVSNALALKSNLTNAMVNLSGILTGTNKNAAVYYDFTNNVLRATITP